MSDELGYLKKKHHEPSDSEEPRFVSRLTKNTYAMVLAGGRGSRLHEMTDWRAKPAVPFGGKFRIIDFVLSNCVNSGIRRIGVATQYKSHSLIQHLQRGWSFLNGQFGEYLDLLPAQQRITEDQWYRGTADAVFQNVDIIRSSECDYVVILAGDHIYKMDYGKLLAFHVEKKADMSVACLEVPLADATAFGVMDVDENSHVVEFVEKPANPPSIPGNPEKSLASMGIYVFSTEFLIEQLIRDANNPESSHDFGQDLIPHLVENYSVFAQSFEQSCVGRADDDVSYWRDVGTIDSYWEGSMELTKVIPDLNMYDNEWPIWTHQEQLPPAKFVFNEAGRPGVRINSYSSIEDSVLLPNVEVGRHVTLKRVIVDKNCKIPDGLEIGVDVEEDRKRFHVSANGITLVTPEMLGQDTRNAL
jgi:glucose-1-phosphate adenylyltransferase